MGVPAFFRWLTKKYPQIIVYCKEQWTIEPKDLDTSTPNPNGVEFDNLYLDMNGIIHPCTHPENKPAPTTEDEMMVAIFECIDRLFAIVRPRKLLYMAIDGVAPRAKMNQQRSRRFRASKEAGEKADAIREMREKLQSEGHRLPPEKKDYFDSNCITPGTPFMTRLSECLNFYIQSKLNGGDLGWKNIKIILSDASVPGEGEHKIMDYIRRQRAQPGHDPNTRHCLCGADADLIMLGLATHEPYFTIIREEFVYNNTPKCDLCGLNGHEMKDCKGITNDDPKPLSLSKEKNQEGYIFVNLYVLREYLESDLALPNIPFNYDFERVIDDWVFLCFFVGNDFLPHLPSMEIRENAIDRLVNIYRRNMMKSNGYLTDSGDVNLGRVLYILRDLSRQEDEIFRKRKNFEDNQKQRNKERTQMEWIRKNGNKPFPIDLHENTDPVDTIQLYVPGYKERYYNEKFRVRHIEIANEKGKITTCYIQGLCWVLKYYYQGCPSWEWFYPFHYAPFASDFTDLEELAVKFRSDTQPFSPLEQLMGVFPAASAKHIPEPWAKLMTDPNSPIRDFYPDDFKIDLNGKRYAWQGVALLPFVDANRLKKATAKVEQFLTKEEKMRNSVGCDRLYVGSNAPCFSNVYSLKDGTPKFGADFKSEGMSGTVFVITAEFYQGRTLVSPVEGMSKVDNNSSLCVRYKDPQYPKGFKFLAKKLDCVKEPEKILIRNRSDDWGKSNYRPQVGMAPSSQRAYLPGPSHRMVGFYNPQPNHLNPYSRDGSQSMTNWKGRPAQNDRNDRYNPYSGGGGGDRGDYQNQQVHFNKQSFGNSRGRGSNYYPPHQPHGRMDYKKNNAGWSQ